jgi:hypothetical protein
LDKYQSHFVESNHWGLIDPNNTTFSLTISRQFRSRRSAHADENSLPDAATDSHPELWKYHNTDDTTWCKWCWLFMGEDTQHIRYLTVSIEDQDSGRDLVSERNGDYDSRRAMTYITKQLPGLERLDLCVDWHISAADWQSWDAAVRSQYGDEEFAVPTSHPIYFNCVIPKTMDVRLWNSADEREPKLMRAWGNIAI